MSSKPSAEALSLAGDQFLGVPYAQMDCQAFVERCLQEIGIRMDLKGSNAWWRKVREEGWVGTPEECVQIFGGVPKGAFLFIWDDDGGEVARGYHDGLGNASHIGLKTGRGKGAIHSSASKKAVVESPFADKTIRNGGWNRVGLWNRLDYGKTVNWLLEHMGIGGKPAEETKEEEKTMTATVKGPNGERVNLRKAAGKSADLVEKIASGTAVEVLESVGSWSRIRAGKLTGWMMTEFLEMDEDFSSGDLDAGADDGQTVALTFTVGELRAALPFLDKMVDQIVPITGRG